MAPEMFKPDYKDKMDFRCDLYSAGLTVYVLATGKHPFAPDPLNAYHTVYRILNVKPEKLHNLRPDLPMDFCALIDRMIKKKPALRFPTPESAILELKKSTP
jgi:serine/threonine protein kinase